MVSCSIKLCKSRSVKGGSLRFLKFPKDEKLANAWLKLCKPRTNIVNARICSLHFLQTDYRRPLKNILLNEWPVRQRPLKLGAVPSQNLDGPQPTDEHSNDSTLLVMNHEIIEVEKETKLNSPKIDMETKQLEQSATDCLDSIQIMDTKSLAEPTKNVPKLLRPVKVYPVKIITKETSTKETQTMPTRTPSVTIPSQEYFELLLIKNSYEDICKKLIKNGDEIPSLNLIKKLNKNGV